MEISLKELCRFTWYGIFIPRSKINKIIFHPWRVTSFTSDQVMLQNLTTKKSKIVNFSEFNRYFATRERLDYLLQQNQEILSKS